MPGSGTRIIRWLRRALLWSLIALLAALAAGAFAHADSMEREGSAPSHLLGFLSLKVVHVAQLYQRLYPNAQAHRSYQPLEASLVHSLPRRRQRVP